MFTLKIVLAHKYKDFLLIFGTILVHLCPAFALIITQPWPQTMKRIILAGALMLLSLIGLQAQSYKIVLKGDWPEEAATVAVQRFTQMLQSGGLAVADDGAALEIRFVQASSMETSGSMSQTAITGSVEASAGSVKENFPVKGVGNGEADAILRAVKQILPRSKAAQAFVEKLR